jgi:plasmid stabilization system protein ParE
VTVIFGDGVDKVFLDLPKRVQVRAIEAFSLIVQFPHMFPVRRRGTGKGYGFFTEGRFVFFYSVSSEQIRIITILPGGMRRT